MRLLILLLAATPALAQPDEADLGSPGDDLPVEGTLRGRKARPAEIAVEAVEVRAGPGAAYVSRGRAYQGDAVSVTRRNEAGDWVEITAEGLRGWVRVGEVRFAGEGVRRGEERAGDSGRDRRQNNYGYDDRGRRIRLDGEPVGSGEGTEDNEAPRRRGRDDDGDGDDAVAMPLRLTLALGVGKIGRDFSSNIDPASALDRLSAGGTGLSTTVAGEWAPRRWLAVRALFRDSRLASVKLPAQPSAGFERAIELAVDAQQLEVDAVGGYPLGPVWLGGYGGARVLRHAFQQTAPYPIFLTDTHLGLGVGARARAGFGPAELTLEGGLVLPLSTSQDPAASGTADGSGFEVRGEFAFALFGPFAVVAQLYWTEITTDFKGKATHQDTVNTTTYTTAQSIDGVLGGGLGVRWAPR